MSQPSTSSRSKTRMGSTPTVDDRHHYSWRGNAIRQLKLIIPGVTTTYYLGTVGRLATILQRGDGSLRSKFALVALGNALAMVTLFLYILFLIHRRGEHPDWRTWRQSGSLSMIIPILTMTIIVGWSLHFFVLGKWTDLGYIRGFVGASGLYALVFGLLALIPAPIKHKDS